MQRAQRSPLNRNGRALVSSGVRAIAWAVAVAVFAAAQTAYAEPLPVSLVPDSAAASPPPAVTATANDTWGAASTPPTAPAVPASARAPEPALLPTSERSCPCPEPGLETHAGPTALAVRYTLEGVEVRGNTRTRAHVVLRYVPFKQGDVFDVDDPEVELSRYRLLGTGFFRDVQFSLRKGSSR